MNNEEIAELRRVVGALRTVQSAGVMPLFDHISELEAELETNKEKLYKAEAGRDRLREALEKVRHQADTHPGWIRDTVDEALNKADTHEHRFFMEVPYGIRCRCGFAIRAATTPQEADNG